MRKNAIDIYNSAMACSSYKYWYGGKGEIATRALALMLQKQNPSVWTNSYYNTALKDVEEKNRVCDCSGLVCIAYDIPVIGSYQIAETFEEWKGAPKIGMVAWRPGHVAIVGANGENIIEMRSQYYDFMTSRTIKSAGMQKILYKKEVDYDAVQTIGWHTDAKGRWYATGNKKGMYASNGFYDIYDRKFYFDEYGYLKTGVFEVDGCVYASTEEGLLCSENGGIKLKYYGD